MLYFISTLNRRQKGWIFLAIDLALIPLALLLTFSLQPLPQPAIAALVSYLPILPYLMVAAALLSLMLGLPNIKLKAYEHTAVGLSALLAAAVTGLSTVLAWVAGIEVPPGTQVVFGIIYLLLSTTSRVVMLRLVTELYRRAQTRCRVLIYGAGTTGLQLAQALRSHDSIDVMAFVDDNSSLQRMRLAGLQVFPPAQIPEIVESRGIHRVLLAMPALSQPKQAQIARGLQQMGLDVQALPSFAQLIGEEPLLEKLTPVPPQAFLGRDAHDMELSGSCQAYADRVVLVSGAGGSIGSELCRQLLNCAPARLVLFEISELALYTVHQELLQLTEGAGIELVPVLGSVTDQRQVSAVLDRYGVQVVLHAAAYKHVPLVEANPLPGLSNNIFGTQALAQAAAMAGVERFILISSDKAVRPAGIMGASKRLAELVVHDLASRNAQTVFTMVRFGNVLGSSGSVVPLFQDQVSRGGPVTVTDPRMTRYFMTTAEAVQLVLRAGADACGGEVFVLDMGKPVPILHLARQVIEGAGYTLRDAANPDGDIEIRISGLRPGEKLEEELTLNQTLVPTRHRKIFCAREETLSEIEIAAILRGLREALASSDEDAAREIILHWAEAEADMPQAGFGAS
ncbi:MAG: nucleoside-diphosphate sugar epimerase/dehydratase [Pseudomonadota bacterium]